VWSIVTHVLIDLLIEPLVLGVGHFVLGKLGVKPLRARWLDSTIVSIVGVLVWVLLICGIGWLAS